MTAPLTISISGAPAAGKTTLLEFLIAKLQEIGAVEYGDRAEHVYRKLTQSRDELNNTFSEGLLLTVDREKVRAELNSAARAKTISLTSDVDHLIFTKEFISGGTKMMVDAIDDESIDACDTIQITVNRKPR